MPVIRCLILNLEANFRPIPSGNFKSAPLSRTSSYTVTPKAPPDIDITFNAVRMYDAALTAQAAMDRKELDNYETLSADANKDGKISLYDAALIAQYAMSSSDRPDSYVADWLFEPPFKKYEPLSQSQTDQDFKAILIGDVNGDWNPLNPFAKPKSIDNFKMLAAKIDAKGDLLIDLIKIYDEELIAAEATIKFNPSILKLNAINLTELTGQFKIYDFIENGAASVGIYSPTPANGNGSIFRFHFNILGETTNITDIEISKYIENDKPAVSLFHTLNLGELTAIPKSLQLTQNYPNPFNGITTIKFGLPVTDKVTIHIYNILGKKVKVLFDKKQLNAGYHKVVWNGRNESGNMVSTGLYFCELLFKSERKLMKMVYVR